MSKKDRYIKAVYGVNVSITLHDKVLKTVENWLNNRGKTVKMIFTPNTEMIVLAQKDGFFKNVLNKADLSLPDSLGVAKKAGVKRITGEKMMMSLIKLADQKGFRVFLLGGKAGVAEKAAEILKKQYPKLKIKGFEGPENVSKASKIEHIKAIKMINDFKTDLLLAGFGHQKQEEWIYLNRQKLKVKTAMGVGGSIDKIVKPWLRAPKWVQSLGLEWLYRLAVEPWRIKRQMALIKFLCLKVKKS